MTPAAGTSGASTSRPTKRAQEVGLRAPAGGSPELAAALEALRRGVGEAEGSPVGAARAVRAVAARHREAMVFDGQRLAFRNAATKLLVPVFGNDLTVAKAVAWLAIDAAFGEGPNGR